MSKKIKFSLVIGGITATATANLYVLNQNIYSKWLLDNIINTIIKLQ